MVNYFLKERKSFHPNNLEWSPWFLFIIFLIYEMIVKSKYAIKELVVFSEGITLYTKMTVEAKK